MTGLDAFTGHSTWPGRVKNAKLGFRGQRSGWNTKNQLHERSSGEVMSRWIRGDCEMGENWRYGKVETRYFFVQTRLASKRSRWENSRVEIKFAGKSEIYTVANPQPPFALIFPLSIV